MSKSEYNVIGVMSGTSLDGLDLAHIQFSKSNVWSFKIHQALTVPYSEAWRKNLSHLASKSKQDLLPMDIDYTALLAQEIGKFIKNNRIENLDAVCSHGHTALHQPGRGLTYQIGNRPELATLIQQTLVCDFRIQDVEMGGQGAPLVPIGDQLLFSEYDYCLNLGGFANISYQRENSRMAYDVCPVNVVLNRYAQLLGVDYDDQGNLARLGQLHQGLLAQLNALPFYKEAAPKSLGYEWVETNVFPLLKRYDLKPRDVLRTFTEHIAEQLAANFDASSKILMTGGGTYNSFLLELLATKKDLKLILPKKELVEFKEALIFGLLGVLKLRGDINCLASVTGANQDHSSGRIFKP